MYRENLEFCACYVHIYKYKYFVVYVHAAILHVYAQSVYIPMYNVCLIGCIYILQFPCTHLSLLTARPLPTPVTVV